MAYFGVKDKEKSEEEEEIYKAPSHLEKFSNATSISSDAYFGREKKTGGGSSSSISGREVDVMASEMMTKLSYHAKQEAEQLKNLAQNAGKKISNIAQNLLQEFNRY